MSSYTDEFIIEKAGDSSMQLTLTNGEAASFMATGTSLVFTAETDTTPLTGITAADPSGLTTVGASVFVAIATDGGDATDCLMLDGTYLQAADTTGCAAELWYFVSGTKCFCSFIFCSFVFIL